GRGSGRGARHAGRGAADQRDRVVKRRAPCAGLRSAFAAGVAMIGCVVNPPLAGPADIGRPGGAGDDFVVNGSFPSGLDGWQSVISDHGNLVRIDIPPGASAPMAHFVVRRITGHSPAWHVNLTQMNQRLVELAPATFYTLGFRARASSPRRLRIRLA